LVGGLWLMPPAAVFRRKQREQQVNRLDIRIFLADRDALRICQRLLKLGR